MAGEHVGDEGLRLRDYKGVLVLLPHHFREALPEKLFAVLLSELLIQLVRRQGLPPGLSTLLTSRQTAGISWQ